MRLTAIAPEALLEDEVVIERIPMSYDEFLDWWDKEAGRRGEWVDGEVIPFMTTSIKHSRLVSFLIRLIGNYLEALGIGEVIGQDFELRTREGSAREPDVLVVLNEHADRFEEMRLRGASDVVVELISPDSVTRDRRHKRAEYAAAGIPEYWLIDPRPGRESIELLVLNAEGSFDVVTADADGRLWSRVLPGLWLDPAWLTADKLPPAGRLGTEMASAEHEAGGQATPQ